MEDLFVARVMSSPVKTLSPDATVVDAAQLMDEHGFGGVVVTDEDDSIEGIITETDIVGLVAEGAAEIADQPVSEYMSSEVVTASATDTLRDAADAMIENDIRRLPVVNGDTGVVGIITTTDLTAYLSHVQKPSPQ